MVSDTGLKYPHCYNAETKWWKSGTDDAKKGYLHTQ